MAKTRKVSNKGKIILIAILAFVLFCLCCLGFYIYNSIKLNIIFNNPITIVEYGSVFDPDSMNLDNQYKIEYPSINTGIMGDTEYTFVVKNGVFSRSFKHTIRVVDTQPPEFEVINNIIITTTPTPAFSTNINGKVKDNYDSNPKMEFVGEINDKPGIYPIDFTASDSSGNTRVITVYYLYKVKPSNMSKPFRYPSEYGDVLLASKKFPLPKNYAPGVNKEAKKQMDKMLAAIKKAGAGSISIRSAYRSYNTQASIFARYAAKDGEAEANRYSAKPGYSEHQSGLAFDIGKVDESFDKTKAFAWLVDHAHEYGFILRYPKNKEAITGYIYEPWHYRYLGVELATKVKESGLTLEEFLKIK